MDDQDGEFLSTYMGDPDVCRFLLHGPMDKSECATYAQHASLFERRTPHFVIVHDTRHDGYVSVHRMEHDTAEIGWVLRPAAHGRGIAYVAAAAIIDAAFDQWQLHRIEARLDPRNVRSTALCRRLGMTEEGCLRESELVGDERRDVVFFSLLRREWEVQRSAS
jgi:RimJ/RimL family protein N-acetyltransferase